MKTMQVGKYKFKTYDWMVEQYQETIDSLLTFLSLDDNWRLHLFLELYHKNTSAIIISASASHDLCWFVLEFYLTDPLSPFELDKLRIDYKFKEKKFFLTTIQSFSNENKDFIKAMDMVKEFLDFYVKED